MNPDISDSTSHSSKNLLGVLVVVIAGVVLSLVFRQFVGDREGEEIDSTSVGSLAEGQRARVPRRTRGVVGADVASPTVKTETEETESGKENTAAEEVDQVPRIRGLVLNPDGRPAKRASVAVFRMKDAKPERNAIACTRSDGDGRFDFDPLKLGDGPLLFLAAAQGTRPASSVMPSPTSALQDELKLELTTGLMIRGRVTTGGVADSGRRLSLDASPGVAGLFLTSEFFLPDGQVRELVWRAGRPEMKHGHAVVDDLGGYQITGLGPGPHTIRVDAAGGKNPEDPHVASLLEAGLDKARLRVVSYYPDRAFVFTAPDLAADIKQDQASLALRFTVPGEARPSKGRVRIVRADPEGIVTHASTEFRTGETVLIRTVAGQAQKVTITVPGYEQEVFDVEALGQGQLSEHLVTLKPRPHLELVFEPQGLGETAVEKISLAFDRIDREKQVSQAVSMGPIGSRFDVTRDSVEKSDDTFRLIDPPLEPGQYRIYAELRKTSFLPVVTTVPIPQHGRVVVPLVVERGVRVDVDLKWPTEPGKYVVVWRLVDRKGVKFHERSMNLSIRENSGMGSGGEDFFYEPVVPPGRYRLQVEVNDFRQVDEVLVVESGHDIKRKFWLQAKKRNQGGSGK